MIWQLAQTYWPQAIVACCYDLMLALNIFFHGQKKPVDTYNGWEAIVVAGFGSMVLHFGGFW